MRLGEEEASVSANDWPSGNKTVLRQLKSWMSFQSQSMAVFLLEVHIKKPIQQVFLMARHLNGEAWLSWTADVGINTVMYIIA